MTKEKSFITLPPDVKVINTLLFVTDSGKNKLECFSRKGLCSVACLQVMPEGYLKEVPEKYSTRVDRIGRKDFPGTNTIAYLEHS